MQVSQRLSLGSIASSLFPAAAIIVIAIPVLIALGTGVLAGDRTAWQHILDNRLIPYTGTTLLVLILAAMAMLIVAVPAAWLVSVYDFPGRRLFSWALILPLAMPGYVMAYAWADLLNVAGPLQSTLRDITGWSARDYWFPDAFSAPGLALILASTLFPYVYITARAAFVSQSLSVLEAARSLGTGPLRLFWSVAVPAARPAILGGLALALMEAAADYGAADFLGVQTLGVGIVRAWSSFGEPATAARLALVLVAIAAAFLIAARALQGRRGSQITSKRWLTPRRSRLRGLKAGLATGACLAIIMLAFAAPLTRLVWLAAETQSSAANIAAPLQSSLILAGLGTAAAFAAALSLVLANRRLPGTLTLTQISVSAGYAAPGVVLGLGALFLLQMSGQALSGVVALALLVWIYVSRFTSAGLEPLQAAMARAPRSLDFAALSLGSTGLARLWRVDLPLLRPGAIAAVLILFVEMIKELPATLMLRPFGWDTLAVRAHAYATDERLAQATFPSVLIVLAGLGPVLLLSWRLARSERT